MTVDVCDIGIGWSIREQAPEESDYEPRNGIVIETVDTADRNEWDEPRRIFKVGRLRNGELSTVELHESVIDLQLACRPSQVQPGVINALVKRICAQVAADKSRKPEYRQWLIKIAYDLSVFL